MRKIYKQFQDLLDVCGIRDAGHVYKTQWLRFFGLKNAERVLQAYPHELSGGMLQRVLCAMAISTKPAWLLADEPTKGLDEQNGAVALQNLQKMKRELATSMIIITHDIKLARDVCDTVLIMYAGQVMERSGKSTLARILLRLIEADSGQIYFAGHDITKQKGAALKSFRRQVQFISQRPESFLDPMLRLGQSLREPLAVHGLTYDAKRVEELLDLVQLNSGILQRYPHQVSGGEIQRICIARALLLEPKLLVLDEPTSMLDISVQAQILHLLKDIQRLKNLSYLFITHDKALADWLCDDVVVLARGRMV